MDKKAIIEAVVRSVIIELNNKVPDKKSICVGISNHHVHLTQQHQDILFGEGSVLKRLRDLSQPGQFVCKETVNVMTHRGIIERVRILGPVRKQTQFELLGADCAKLGIKAPLRESGNLEDSGGGYMLVGPKGSVWLENGAIIAKRHIHMHSSDAKSYGVRDGQIVNVKVNTERGGIYSDTVVRVSDKFKLEFHVDFDEGNAMLLNPGDIVEIV